MPLPRKRPLIFVTAALILGAAVSGAIAQAQGTPGHPDAYVPYGQVQTGAGNISPPVQTILAIVNGKVCGMDQTLIATAGPGTPEEEVGKTVYSIEVKAEGPNVFDIPGCGKPGDTVVFYLPVLGRLADQRVPFKSAVIERANLTFTTVLPHRVINPSAAKDGAQ
ncbi:hypothetical protein AYO38_02690 [bacterium SCGC AG-212-C10]|nr:hypothetical protein AYO38_02690 [bacterium SCGC AG-212-C10]